MLEHEGDVMTRVVENIRRATLEPPVLAKRSIRGTRVRVWRKQLAKYLVEFEFRWNLRHAPETMFPLLLERLAT